MRRLLLLGLSCACVIAPGTRLRAAAPVGPGAPKVDFESYALPNGLSVILHVDRKLPLVHVNLWYHVGSKNERLGRSGFAHLFEHMMFEGSKNAKEKYFSYAEKAGANVFEGGINGTTDWDRTNYFATVPSGGLEFLLWLESDRLATLGDAVTEERFANQRDVVRNERRQGLENVPYGRWIKLVAEGLYPIGHPYANDVIGTHEDLKAATLDDIKTFFATYYTPNNLVLCIAGDFEPAAAKGLVEKYFGGIPAGPALDRPARHVPPLTGEKTIEVADRVPQERTYFAWQTPAFFEPGDAEMDLAAAILADGLSSRLNKALVYDRQIASDVAAFQMSREAGSIFVVWATARPGAALAAVERGVGDEVARLASEGPTPAELARAQTKWEYGFVSGLERIGGFGGKADRLNMYKTYLGAPGRFEADLARHRDVTAEGLRAAVGRYLSTPNRLLVRFHPESSSREARSSLDRSAPPPLGADRPFAAPAVQSARLGNGMELLVVERPDLPKVNVTLVTRAGNIYDPPGKAGVAGLMVTNVKLGTKARNALQIGDAMGDLGSSISGAADRERSTLGFEVLKRNLDAGLAVFADVVKNPVFPESEFAREKALRLDALAQESRNPYALASRLAPMLRFGREHPYGRADLPGSVGAITRDDLQRFHAANWKAAASALVFAGDVTLAEATALATKHFGDWAGAGPTPLEIPPPGGAAPGKIYLVDRQDAAQTMMLGVLPGPPRTSADYAALRLADGVFGNGVTTRLNLNLREAKGYSYGMFSFLGLLSKSGVWSTWGTVQTDKTKESVVELLKEVRNIGGEKPITEAELAYAKTARVRGYAQQFESLGRIAGQVAELWALGLPMTELDREPKEIEKTTLALAEAAARKYAAPESFALLLVGDASKIEGPLRELKLGEIVRLDVEGRSVAEGDQ
jgi:zinc protease